jgi:hypothetical protein
MRFWRRSPGSDAKASATSDLRREATDPRSAVGGCRGTLGSRGGFGILDF